ncbi:MAG: LptF/LptG family permease [Planctomycetes bacterium]|nr:LptF/LptG family permease [Planctomycetota bacterium]
MSRLDRYVGRIVLGSFTAALAFFMLLIIIMDILAKMPRYVRVAEEQGFSTLDLIGALLWHYTLFLPVFFVTMAPFVTVIACMFAIARLQHANEVVPMLFVGRPMRRILRPLMLCGLLSGISMAACWQWVVPQVAPAITESDEELNRGIGTQKHLVDESTDEGVIRRLYVTEFEPAKNEVTGVSMLLEAVLAADSVLITAKKGVWDGERGDWHLIEGWREGVHKKVPVEWLGRGDLTPELLLQRGREAIEADTLSYTELAETMALRPNRADVRLALHRHITFPLANLILLMLVLPLAVWFERGSRIERILTAIGLCGAYALFDLTCQSLGGRGHLHPVVAAWSPTILFGSLGVVMYGGIKS